MQQAGKFDEYGKRGDRDNENFLRGAYLYNCFALTPVWPDWAIFCTLGNF